MSERVDPTSAESDPERRLISALRDANEHVRLAALESMQGDAAPPAAVDAAADLLSDSSARIRATALRIVGQLGNEAHCRRVVLLLSDPFPNVRRSAMLIAARLPCREAAERLRSVAGEAEDDRDRTAALEAVIELGHTPYESLLLKALHDPSERVRKRAAEAVHDAAPNLLGDLSELVITDPSPTVRAAAARSLAGSDQEYIVPLSHALLRDPERKVRVSAAHAISSFGHAAGPFLAKALGDRDSTVRMTAVRRLGSLNTPDIIQPLRNLTEGERDEEVRAEALKALSGVDPTVGALLQRFAGARPLFDPENSSTAFTTWLKDLNYYPASPGITFYNTGALKVFDEDDEYFYRYRADGGQIQVFAANNPTLTSMFHVEAESFSDAYGRTQQRYRLTITQSGPPIDAPTGPSHFFLLKRKT
ncbi:HEAT repeat domain-containing protein [Streptomyces sp. NPDC050263]|uniref:HEAT repeat domain-containing protein n=1 Tax=Streptomyces sp. NPDC050263 TaxID=3155037 RepID=UPI003427CA2C